MRLVLLILPLMNPSFAHASEGVLEHGSIDSFSGECIQVGGFARIERMRVQSCGVGSETGDQSLVQGNIVAGTSTGMLPGDGTAYRDNQISNLAGPTTSIEGGIASGVPLSNQSDIPASPELTGATAAIHRMSFGKPRDSNSSCGFPESAQPEIIDLFRSGTRSISDRWSFARERRFSRAFRGSRSAPDRRGPAEPA